MKRLSRDKDLNKYLNELISQGWTSEVDGRNHTKMTSPDGVQVRAAFTPTSSNAVHAVRRLVKNRSKEVAEKSVHSLQHVIQ